MIEGIKKLQSANINAIKSDDIYEVIDKYEIATDQIISDINKIMEVLEGIKTGDCFCECGIGNPMLKGNHTEKCKKAKKLLDEWRKQ